MTDNQIIYVSCPHKDLVEINILEINCAIFRHGILKKKYGTNRPSCM